MFLNKIHLYYQTIKHVKATQLYHQVYYRVKNKIHKPVYKDQPVRVSHLTFSNGILYNDSWLGNNCFSFLNLKKDFGEIDWNFSAYGKLWTYNLNYFDFLNQKSINREQGVELIKDYISKKDILKDGIEPYPISLRGINWIKFLCSNNINDPKINNYLFNDYQKLADNLEYHLLANHLLENGFSLLFGAYYFQDERLYVKAQQILKSELQEQILNDGSHYELSPMYHQIILHRVLDSYNLVRNNNWKDKELLSLLQGKAEIMLGWLDNISFDNGEIPNLNDATDGIALTTKELLKYASDLGLHPVSLKLSKSGYRKFQDSEFEILIDVGQIAPTYQPGHSHADSLQFLLNFNENPIFVDAGISTYEKNEHRQLERSTSSHNTVTINGKNSSNVWGGFRVAERATVKVLKDTSSEIEAEHNGYRKLGLTHRRKFSLQNEIFKIKDYVLAESSQNFEAKGHLHFHPDVQIKISGNNIFLNNDLHIEFSENTKLEILDYKFAEGFNKLIAAKKLVYSFKNQANFSIKALSY